VSRLWLILAPPNRTLGDQDGSAFAPMHTRAATVQLRKSTIGTQLGVLSSCEQRVSARMFEEISTSSHEHNSTPPPSEGGSSRIGMPKATVKRESRVLDGVELPWLKALWDIGNRLPRES